MNILYINTYYQGGGAEKVMRQLYKGCRDSFTNTYCVVGRIQKNIDDDVKVIYKTFLERCITMVRGKFSRNSFRSARKARNEIIKIIKEESIDVVHFHNIHGNYLGIKDINCISQYCSNIVITMHDMWTFTGGCAHSCECNEWKNIGCKNCKGNYTFQKFRTADTWLGYKKKYLTGKHIYYVAPSEWLKNLAVSGILKNNRIDVIPNGVDLNVYKEHSQSEMRVKYGLPKDKHLLLFVANGTNNIYKGYSYLVEALKQIEKKEEFGLVIVGNREPVRIEGYEVHCFGYVSEEKKLSELYSAADIYIQPSMADVSSYTSMESIASGTPVIAFATGGIPEIVTEEVGWLVERGNSEQLCKCIEFIFQKENIRVLQNKRSSCRNYAIQHLGIENMITNYKGLYNRFFGGNKDESTGSIICI